ncbi:hypothetical protein HMF8227_02447 [Saliniradius amylolyticus]|uniref:Uncharacterized protein n=1 Tax=Saliniradius amylolyticus TaxID=2183582 RepID=A0A2S2E5M4_9ALTE|nr:hypothetical protein [Saliniradius amylolyticus]AWL12899.1 hypothetical protein HMF8227_02447 [Saliniradius amylolyticus]
MPEIRTLRDVNNYKKQLTFGDISPFYHAVSTSLGAAEGMLNYGFGESLKPLLNQRNWNPDMLGGKEDALGDMQFTRKPRISIYKLFTRNGFEIHCIPWVEQREFDQDMAYHPQMDFKVWNVDTMKAVLKIARLHEFIEQYFERGDEADLELIKLAHNITEDFVDQLAPQFDTQKVHGVSVKGFFDFVAKRRETGEEVFLPKVYDIAL